MVESKKDAKLARDMFVKGMSRAALERNKKLLEIISFIIKEIDAQFPESETNHSDLN